MHQLLSDLGVDRPESMSNCLKAGIINGCINTLKHPAEDPKGNWQLPHLRQRKHAVPNP